MQEQPATLPTDPRITDWPPSTENRTAKLEAVANSARRLQDCLAEFGVDAHMACGEYSDALDEALAKLEQQP
jgi:hypothetical protein